MCRVLVPVLLRTRARARHKDRSLVQLIFLDGHPDASPLNSGLEHLHNCKSSAGTKLVSVSWNRQATYNNRACEPTEVLNGKTSKSCFNTTRAQGRHSQIIRLPRLVPAYTTLTAAQHILHKPPSPSSGSLSGFPRGPARLALDPPPSLPPTQMTRRPIHSPD